MPARRSLSILGALACTGALVAQSYATLPPGYLTKESPGNSHQFGSYNEMRAQICSMAFRGSTRTFRQIDFRVDGNYRQPVNQGRTWSRVQAQLGEVDITKTTTTFTTNLTSNVKTVYDKKTTWPPTRTGPLQRWGQAVTFPFTSPYAYSGKSDLTVDFQFHGGVLQNGTRQFWQAYYLLDAIVHYHGAGNTAMYAKQAGNLRCGDFAVAPATLSVVKRIAGGQPSNLIQAQPVVTRYPLDKNALIGVGVTRSLRSIQIGNPCNQLWVHGTYFVIPFRSPPIRLGHRKLWWMYAPFTQSAVGLNVVTQAAYVSPTRNRFELGYAGYAPIQAQPPWILGYGWTFHSNVHAQRGVAFGQAYVPILRLKY